MLRLITLLVLAPLVCLPMVAQQSAQGHGLRWVSSTQSEPWKEVDVQPQAGGGLAEGGAVIRMDDGTRYQTIDGFGSCFNDLGWQALELLEPRSREEALKQLFSKDGANFTLGRVPMGANDFSTEWYSFDETPGDYGMRDFSIDHDRQTLLPFVHAAMKYQPKLAVWGVPWSPPAWMKTNGAYKGGSMRDDPKVYASYALYFSKYVQAYRKEGIRLYAVMPQNEPKYNNNVYPQASWTGAQMNVFLRDYLVPQLKKDGEEIQVWQGTIVNEKLADFILPVLDDPRTNPLVTGIAYQYDGQRAMSATHERYPGKKMMQSETECYNGENSWQQGLITFRKMIEDTNHSAGSYFFWNTVLSDESKSTWGWKQNSLLTVDRKTKQVRYNPEFYSMKHFSAHVLAGATRIAVSGGSFPSLVAFRNPTGDKVLELENDTDAAEPATIRGGGRVYRVTVPAKSMNTMVIPAGD